MVETGSHASATYKQPFLQKRIDRLKGVQTQRTFDELMSLAYHKI
jgi:chromosome segregation and condensation protein ScpB